jgi:hypothetical protein
MIILVRKVTIKEGISANNKVENPKTSAIAMNAAIRSA